MKENAIDVLERILNKLESLGLTPDGKYPDHLSATEMVAEIRKLISEFENFAGLLEEI